MEKEAVESSSFPDISGTSSLHTSENMLKLYEIINRGTVVGCGVTSTVIRCHGIDTQMLRNCLSISREPVFDRTTVNVPLAAAAATATPVGIAVLDAEDAPKEATAAAVSKGQIVHMGDVTQAEEGEATDVIVKLLQEAHPDNVARYKKAKEEYARTGHSIENVHRAHLALKKSRKTYSLISQHECAALKALQACTYVNAEYVTPEFLGSMVLAFSDGGKTHGLFFRALPEHYVPLAYIDIREITADTLHAIKVNLIRAVAEMHKRGVCHSDIKPDNILVDVFTGNVRLIDFGHSCSRAAVEACLKVARELPDGDADEMHCNSAFCACDPAVTNRYYATTYQVAHVVMFGNMMRCIRSFFQPSWEECVQNDWYSLFQIFISLAYAERGPLHMALKQAHALPKSGHKWHMQVSGTARDCCGTCGNIQCSKFKECAAYTPHVAFTEAFSNGARHPCFKLALPAAVYDAIRDGKLPNGNPFTREVLRAYELTEGTLKCWLPYALLYGPPIREVEHVALDVYAWTEMGKPWSELCGMVRPRLHLTEEQWSNSIM